MECPLPHLFLPRERSFPSFGRHLPYRRSLFLLHSSATTVPREGPDSMRPARPFGPARSVGAVPRRWSMTLGVGGTRSTFEDKASVSRIDVVGHDEAFGKRLCIEFSRVWQVIGRTI